jgi:carbon-monoxide dehydrogenase large subunit
VAGNAAAEAAAELRARCLNMGAMELGVDVNDVKLENAAVSAAGRTIDLLSLAEAAAAAGDPLEAMFYYEPPTVTWSHGAHAASIAVNRETCELSILHYAVVHDCGNVINPAIVEGQVQGAVTQGIGAALFEEILYDDTGQLLNASLADYLIPTATDTPEIMLAHLTSPSPLNRLGIKGMGEGGAVPPPAAITNALEDALADDGAVVRRRPLRPSYVRVLLTSPT